MSDKTKLNLLAPIAGFLVAVAFGVGVIATAALGDDDDPTGTASGGTGDPIHVTLGDLFIEPASLQASPGELAFEIHNEGGVDHNLVVSGLGSSEMIASGDIGTLVLDDVEPGTYEMICAVPGHADGGMKATLTVGEGASDVSDDTAHGSMMAGTPEEMAMHDAERTGSFPAETEGKGGVPLEPRIAADGAKVFEVTASEVQWETEPGKTVSAYAYNGMVPGPEIRAQVGDRVRVVLHNELPEPTTIHFHGLEVPNRVDGVPAINQDAVLPGESFRYEFTVKNSGSHMYHSHFNAVAQVPKGLLGAFIVEDSIAETDVDFTMILNDGPLGFTINGKGFPATAPIVAERGQTVRIRYMNEGLQIHPMHLHGMAQKVIAKDGYPLPQPYEADTILVGPGERYDVLVEADAPGVWAYHCHILSHAEGPDGMFGMVTAMVVE